MIRHFLRFTQAALPQAGVAELKTLQWPSYAPILLAAVLGTSATWALFSYVSKIEQQHAQDAFSDAARDRLWALRRETAYTLGSVRHIGSFFGASRSVSRRQFREFVEPMSTRYPGAHAFLWVPRLEAAQREELVEQAQRSLPTYDIRPIRPAETPPEALLLDDGIEVAETLYPILFVQPYPPNRDLLGVDLGTLPETARTLKAAVAERTLHVTPPVPIPIEQAPGPDETIGFLAFLPVYDQSEPEKGIALAGEGDLSLGSEPLTSAPQFGDPLSRKAMARGFAGGLFRVQDIVHAALSNLRPSGIDIQLYFGEAGAHSQPFYTHRSRVFSPPHGSAGPEAGSTRRQEPLRFVDQIQVGDQSWTLVASAVPGHFESDLSSSTLILGSGLAFTVLACIYLASMIGQARQVRRLVAERTLELERSNAALNQEIRDRQHAEKALKLLNLTLEQRIAERTAESERRARDLEQFAYVASHDLKAPLRGIANLATWLSEDLADRLTPDIAEQLALMRDRVARMHALIEGLLSYSRIGRIAGTNEPIDLTRLIAETIDSLDPPSGFRIEITSELPDLTGDSLALGMVLGNLIGNAIRHHDRAQGRIEVGVRCQGELCEFTVEDDGPGIPPEFHENVFMMFQTMKVKDVQGDTGIGLALVKKLVEEHGGRIHLHSGPGRGCRFVFTWPRRPATPNQIPSDGVPT